ncbi:DUF3097 domain-containing protein [Kribbella turkmenica]|uniref:DUF3097 domain-containing protein n=1 Tax=Kribbella turkmenica TaxID=2530375 RepID=A0A4R4XCF6_9ACTN|nr:DUF3097 domain-containing protein [Kribbella turkmenica]TDD28254.1 DUF3097 domain-containing protein [Kribbella turkmenica]
MADRYGNDVLAGDWRRPRNGRTVEVELEKGMVVEEPSSGFVGAVVRWEHGVVDLEDRFGRIKTYPLGPGFWLDGKPVSLTAPKKAGPAKKTRTASGSVAVDNVRARVARAGRIYVEGRHDAELVEKVWGDDLRIEGVVVEYLEGVDDLPGIVNRFRPGPGRRLGVLVDHLVEGSKESRIAAQVTDRNVLVVGHPFIDIWAAVKPSAVGIKAWPRIPHGQDWKKGVLQAFGWPATDQADVAAAWKHILSRVNSYADLEPALLGRVEELIDFVTLD